MRQPSPPVSCSPSRLSMWACPAAAGYCYRDDAPALRPGWLRSRSEGGTDLHREALADIGAPAGASPIRAALQDMLGRYWGHEVDWSTEVHLTHVAENGATLQGHLDLLGTVGKPTVVIDLKTKTGVPRGNTEPYAEVRAVDRQLLFYAGLVLARYGVVPDIYLAFYFIGAKSIYLRRYMVSEAAVRAVLDYAARVAVAIAALPDDPLRWPRTWQCEEPFPCPYKTTCYADMGLGFAAPKGDK